MHRNLITLTSAFAVMIGLAGYGSIAQAHEGEEQCNVLLDGDGEPVKESDSDVIEHSNSHACGPEDAAESEVDAPAEVSEEQAPEQVANVAPAPTIEPLTVYFDSNRDSLSAGSNAQVQAFADQLVATNPKSVEVVGYTDTSGSVALNEKLSKARASNVIASLISAGVPADLIAEDALGEGELAVDTPDGTREPNNRRVIVTPVY